jgi:hypothetical protein
MGATPTAGNPAANAGERDRFEQLERRVEALERRLEEFLSTRS